MYNTTDDYKSKIYDTVHFLKVYINEVEIESKYILDCRPSSTLFTNGEIELGSTPSQTVELKLYKSVVPTTINKVEIKSGITGEIVPIGIYNVDKAPTSDDYTVTLSLADNMIKFEFNYDGSKLVNDNNGKAKIIQVLQDMCSKAGVELGSTSFLNMNKVIAVYDNTVSARTYLSYIAEQAGGFAFIGRDSKLYIKSFKYALGKKIGEGKSIVIEKTNNLKAKTVIKGEHSQKTTEGRNLFNPKISTKTTFGVTVTQEGKHRIKLNGQGSGGWAVRFDTIHKFEKGKSYTVTIRKISGSVTQVSSYTKWGFLFYPESSNNTHVTFMPSDTVINWTFKAEESNTAPYIWIGWNTDSSVVGTNSVFNNLILEISIVEGNSAKDYEDYTGGKPSPNVDYPQEVETVGDNVNLINVNNMVQALLDTNNGTLILNKVWRCTDYLDVFFKEYNFSWESDSTFFQVKVCFYDKSKKFLSSLNYGISDIYSKSFEVPAGTRFIRLAYSVNVNNVDVTREKIKLEKGNVRTPYSNYNQGSTEIIKRNRNQFDIAEQTIVSNGITSNYKDGKFSLVGTGKMNWTLLTQSKTPFYLKAGEYTVSVYDFNVEENYSLEFTLYHADNTSTKMYLDKYNKHRTYTVEKDVTGLTVVLSKFKAGDILDLEFSVQLEEGKISTDWILPRSEDFIVPIQREMLEGDYIDDTEHHLWDKLVLTGTEPWYCETNGRFGYLSQNLPNAYKKTILTSDLLGNICNSYIEKTPTQTWTGVQGFCIDPDGSLRIWDNSYSKISDLAGFKAMLAEKYNAGNPVVCYLKLATPIELELTDDQKKVLKEIQNMDLYEDYTIIESEAEMQVNFARAEIPIKYFQNFEWGAKYKLSKIRYEDGIRVLEKGDDTGNTLYINPDNIFIVDQEQIDNIYDELKDLELYSFKGDSIVDPALDIGDIVVINGKQVLYCGSSQYSGRWKASISSEIKSKERQETTVVKKPSQKTINRRVQSSIDQVNGKIEQLIEENTETSETLSRHEQTLDGFTNTVSKIEKDVESVKSTANSSVKKVEVKYALSDNSTEAPATGWNTTAPTWTEGKYMWQKTVTTFVDGSVSESNATCIQGAKGANGVDGKDGKDGVNGEKGDKGETGKGIKSVVDQYYLSASNTTQTGGAWKNTQDEWKEGKYIWTRSFITWTDNTTSYTTPCLADSINKANQVANDTAKNLENNYSTTKETETMIKQESDSIRLEVDTIEKFTREISSHRELHLVDTADYAENLVLTLKIYGETEEWKELAPSISLAPSTLLAPMGTTIDLIVDSQSRLNPSEDTQVFTINYGKKLRSLGNVRDELDIINNKVTIIRRIGINNSGQEYVLQEEQTEELGELKLPTLKDNTYIYVREYPNLEYFCRYITDNEYIKKFATQEGLKEATVDLNTKIEQSNKEIILLARQKVGKDEVIASINLTPEKAKILAKLIELEGIVTANQNFKILLDGSMEATNGKFTGGKIQLENGSSSNPTFLIGTGSTQSFLTNEGFYSNSDTGGKAYIFVDDNEGAISILGNSGQTFIRPNKVSTTGEMWATAYNYQSQAKLKENIVKFQREALYMIKNSDIYEFNYKNNSKEKTIGLVIGDGYNTPQEIISNKKGINSYSMVSISWKAIQELDQKIEKMINILKKIPIFGRIFTKRWKNEKNNK